MFQQFTIARSGFETYQRMMFNITNNISNAQTPGYKQTRVELASLFPIILQEAELEHAEDDNLNPYIKKKRGIELGTGVRIEAVTTDFSEGNIEITNNELDVSIRGEGFYQFRKPDGQMVYSRAGNFARDVDGNIMSQSGYVLDPPIRIPYNSSELTIDSEGRVYASINGSDIPTEVGQVLLARFENPDGLQNVGNNFYRETLDSGTPIVDTPGRNMTGQLVQFSRENSNVDIIKEMMEMILTQKGLELLGKAMQAGEAMLKAGMGMT